MNWFFKWLYKKLEVVNRSEERESINTPEFRPKAMAISKLSDLGSRGMNFTVYHGIGGYAVEIREYNTKTDRHDTQLHIISSDKDLGQSLTHIITYELIKQ